MKTIILAAAILTLSGCGAIDRMFVTWTGDATSVCKYGVEYLQFTSGSSVAYNQDGSVRKCN